ncbi:MAG: oligosaccharide flippase family protein, partial [Pseudomonadota bacterium]
MFKSLAQLLSSTLAVRLLLLVRTAILARILTVEDYGIVTTFTMTVALTQMVGALGFQQMVVQDKEGDDAKLVNALHSLQLMRGIALALLLFVLAEPYARLLGVGVEGEDGMEYLVWPFQLLAIFPLTLGFQNLDLFRRQRTGDFTVFAIWTALGPVAGLLLLGALLLIFDDWRIGLYSVIGTQIFTTAATHYFAERRFTLGADRSMMRKGLAFGLPLLGNSVLLYLILNGDRIIVSKLIGLEALAFMAIALGLAQVPVSVLAKVHQTMFLPFLSRAQDAPPAFTKALVLAMESRMALSLMMVVGLAIFGPDLARIIYGPQYAAIGALVIWAGLFHAIRTLKGAPSTAAVAKGATTNPLYSNLVRAAMLPVALYVAWIGGSLEHLLMLAVLAEVISFGVSLWLLGRTLGGLPRQIWPTTLGTFAVMALVAADILLFPPQTGLFASFHL